MEPRGAASLDLRVRFLQVQVRGVEELVSTGGEQQFRPVEALEVDGRDLLSWEEGFDRQFDAPPIVLRDVAAAERTLAFEIPGGREVEPVSDASGHVRGRVVRERWRLNGVVRVSAEAISGLWRVRVRVENTAAWSDAAGADRNLALRQAFVSLHCLLAVHDGDFVSLLDPPPPAREAAAACRNLHAWPVLVGPEPRRDVMLSSPIILYDYPAVAPESPGELCDSTEIDEILMLRVMTMTEDEKRAARATDPRAREIVDRSENMPPEIFERLHGALRSVGARDGGSSGEPPVSPGVAALATYEPPAWTELFGAGAAQPGEACVRIGSHDVSRGSRVRLAPTRRADTMDLFLRGRAARVEGVFRDVDEQAYLGVTVEDDPAAELHGGYGRLFYFYPDEVEPLECLGSQEAGYQEGVNEHGQTDPRRGDPGGGRGGRAVAAGPRALSQDPADVS